MAPTAIRRFGFLVVTALIIIVMMSLLFSVPYVFTAVGVAAWLFFGHLITIDDDFPGGWSNQDGAHPFPWRILALKGVVFVALCLAAALPEVRRWGGV